MNMKKIGAFLKVLRREKGLTQEQLAEALFVSGKTVSRWETGTNLPDISVLMQIAAFYGVEVKEILEGERQHIPMNQALEETLNRAADYGKLQKEQAARVGNIAFVLTFAVCAAATVFQLALGASVTAVLGETAALAAGGVAYIGLMVYHGLGEAGAPSRELLTGAICSVGATGVFVLRSARMGLPPARLAPMAAVFLAVVALLGFGLMKAIARLNGKRKKPD